MHNNVGNTWNHGYFPVCASCVKWHQYHILESNNFTLSILPLFTHTVMHKRAHRIGVHATSIVLSLPCIDKSNIVREHTLHTIDVLIKNYFTEWLRARMWANRKKCEILSWQLNKILFPICYKRRNIDIEFSITRSKYSIIRKKMCAQRVPCWNSCRLIIYWKVNLVEKMPDIEHDVILYICEIHKMPFQARATPFDVYVTSEYTAPLLPKKFAMKLINSKPYFLR